MLPADELFSGGKLVPLRLPSSSEAAAGADLRCPQPTTQNREGEVGGDAERRQGCGGGGEQRRSLRIRQRWRDCCGSEAEESASSSSSSSSSTETKPLRRLRPWRSRWSRAVLASLRDPNDADMPPVGSNSITDPPPPVSTSQHHLPKIRLTSA
ncbi:hypothetical protein ZWY2020_002525 [Hordeum vulgare]|nr:hypothetical protein ZWY2020_002525 [Hordeum vulgare]